ncbi:MAG: hydrogenase maturation factor, partial [Lachnospiraceae bacterium]|nr:hydrogenase maturation factor [Lachnospiraceae bacterium]
ITIKDLASAVAEPIGILLTVLLPVGSTEEDLAKIMEDAEEACSRYSLQVLGGHTETTAVVSQPLVSVTGVAKAKKGRLLSTGGAKPGMDLVATKWIGIEGTSILAKEREEALRERFAGEYVARARELDRFLCVLPEGRIAAEMGAGAMHDVTEGGILGALWEMAEASGVGVEVWLSEIPIRQETVEICEFFDINPYRLISSGCMLVAIEDGHALVRRLEQEGIPARVIGRATEGSDRVVLAGDRRQYLTPPEADELYKAL